MSSERRRRYGRGSQEKLEEAAEMSDSFWMSYGDLFAALLLIFALMLLSALYFYQSGVDGIREILLVRQEIVEELEERLEADDGRIVEIDPDGVVRFLDRVLFDQNSAEISSSGRDQLSSFARQYVAVIFENDRFLRRLERIVVEGHTNDDGDYVYNLRLSQARALAVMEAILEAADDEVAPTLKEKVTANGRSFSDLIYVDAERTEVDKEASRRIEIRFDLDDRHILQQMMSRVFGS